MGGLKPGDGYDIMDEVGITFITADWLVSPSSVALRLFTLYPEPRSKGPWDL